MLNAGVAPFRPLDAWDEAAFDQLFAVNVKGPFFLTQALLPLLDDLGAYRFARSLLHREAVSLVDELGADNARAATAYALAVLACEGEPG